MFTWACQKNCDSRKNSSLQVSTVYGNLQWKAEEHSSHKDKGNPFEVTLDLYSSQGLLLMSWISLSNGINRDWKNK